MTEFLYLLMRDHLPVGIVQIILDEVEKDIATRKTVLYTNKHLEAMARSMAEIIIPRESRS